MLKLLSIVCSVVILASSSFGLNGEVKKVSIAQLIEEAKELDGLTVELYGEAIGDKLNRGEYYWVNVSDGNNSAIGVFMTAADAQKIDKMGDYATYGDKVRIVGVFHRACTQHSGDLDIHALSVEMISKWAIDSTIVFTDSFVASITVGSAVSRTTA